MNKIRMRQNVTVALNEDEAQKLLELKAVGVGNTEVFRRGLAEFYAEKIKH